MALIKADSIMKYEVLTKKGYSDKYGNGITTPGLTNAIKNDRIDYTVLGDSKEQFIVMTEKTKKWKPREDAGRSRAKK